MTAGPERFVQGVEEYCFRPLSLIEIYDNSIVYEDFPINETQFPVAIDPSLYEDFPINERDNSETKRFSVEQRGALQKKGYVIYKLTEKSLADLSDAGNKIWFCWSKEYMRSEFQKSINSEVAVRPNKLFLPNSNDKTFAEQRSMIIEFSKEISEEIPGVKAIIGTPADYMNLTFLISANYRLFKKNNRHHCTRTSTRVGSDMAFVGYSYYIHVDSCSSVYRRNDLFIAPLIVPAENK